MNNLKYLFEVVYKDGSKYKQNKEDRAVIKEQGSSFSDVICEEIKTFSLIGNGHRYLVNLEDGHFEIDGLPFKMHQDQYLRNFRIVYWRDVCQSMRVQVKDFDKKVLGIDTTTVYRLGWQTNDKDGQNIQRVMTIS